MEQKNKLLRAIPKTDELLNDMRLQRVMETCGRTPVVEAVRQTQDQLRQRILGGDETVCTDADSVIGAVLHLLRQQNLPSLRRVINATGIILHTNLGRAPLCDEAATAACSVAGNYSTLEYDCSTGGRGSRYSHVEQLLCRLCGTEAALVVNNNASAVLLILGAMAKGGEVVVSRGELVEIGGAFRVPDVMEQSGCVLREIGTTNKTHPADYTRAIGEQTRALLKVHTSNYKIVGFTEEVPAQQLSVLAHEAGLPLLYDLGSGALFDTSAYGLSEPSVFDAVRAGADVVSFSGDKLLGGPQAGIIVGKKEYIEKMRKHPLTRALRIDKMTLAALEATLRIYLDPTKAKEKIPLLRMLSESTDVLRARARALRRKIGSIADLDIRITDELGQVGGGSAPYEMIPSVAVSIACHRMTENALEQALRQREVPIIARIAKNRLIFDMRTVRDDELSCIAQALSEILA